MSLSDWNHTYSNHSAWQAIEDTIELVRGHEGNDDTQSQQIDRIRITLAAVLDLRNTPTVMVSQEMLQQLEQTVRGNIHGAFTNWVSSGNPAYLNNAHTNLHTVLEAARGWPISKQQNLRSAAAVLRELVKASSMHVESMRITAQETIEKLQNQLTLAQQEMDDRDKRANEKFNEVAAQAGAVFAKLQETEKRNDNLVNVLQARFDEAEEQRVDSHQSLHDDQRSEFGNLINIANSNHKQTLERHEAEAKESQERIEQLKKDIEGVIGAVGTTATAKWYKDHADLQGKEANFWRWIAVGGLLLASLYSFVWLTWFHGAESELRSTIFRGLLSLTLIGIATYSTAESRGHRKQEIAARSTELKLRAFDPFVATLKEPDRNLLKMESTRYMFMNDGKTSLNSLNDHIHAYAEEDEE